MVLALGDSSGAEQIRQAGELHRDLTVEITGDVVTLEATARQGGAAALVLDLDLDLAGPRAKGIVHAWRDGASAGAPRPVLLTGTGAGGSRARELGAQAWLPRARPPSTWSRSSASIWRPKPWLRRTPLPLATPSAPVHNSRPPAGRGAGDGAMAKNG